MSDIVEILLDAAGGNEAHVCAIAAAEIERLQANAAPAARLILSQQAEIELLRQQVTQRGARMQVMRDYLTQYSGSSTTLWRDFCRVKPEAVEWFDGNGVPR